MPKKLTKTRTRRLLKPVGSAALTLKAFRYAQRVCRKANDGLGYDRTWDEVPGPTQKGFLAMTRFIIRAVKPNE